MKPYPCIESTIDFGHNGVTIRLWIDQQSIEGEYEGELDLKGILTAIVDQDLSRDGILKAIQEQVPNVAAAQLIDKQEEGARRGVVAYYTSFETDPHG